MKTENVVKSKKYLFLAAIGGLVGGLLGGTAGSAQLWINMIVGALAGFGSVYLLNSFFS